MPFKYPDLVALKYHMCSTKLLSVVGTGCDVSKPFGKNPTTLQNAMYESLNISGTILVSELPSKLPLLITLFD